MPALSKKRLRAVGCALLLSVPLLFSEPMPARAQGVSRPPAAKTALEKQQKAKSLIFGEGETLWGVFQKGGWVMWCILGASIIGLTFFFERAIELRRAKHIPKDFDKDLVHAVDQRGVDAGLAQCLERKSSLARVLYAALLRYGTSRQEMEAAVQDEGSRLLYDLRRNGRVIGIMSNIAPLMGLLGTVLGLIGAFDKVSAAGGLGKTELLAGGVAVALLTTAFGLIVAIPLFFMYHYARGRADDLVREIEEKSIDAIVTLARKARRSIQQLEDVEENLDTKELVAAREHPPPNLDGEFEEDKDLERAIKTSVHTPPAIASSPSKFMAAIDEAVEIDREGATQVDVKALSGEAAAPESPTPPPEAPPSAQPPRQIQPPESESTSP